MATVTTDTNGRVRKSLAEQIDRLDGILDGLADGLNEAVVTAVKEAVGIAVKEAVRAVLSEVLANSDLLHSIRDSLTPPVRAGAQPTKPTETQGAGAAVSVRLGVHMYHAIVVYGFDTGPKELLVMDPNPDRGLIRRTVDFFKEPNRVNKLMLVGWAS